MVTVKRDNMTQVFVSSTERASNIMSIGISDWDRTKVVLTVLVFHATLSLLLLLSFLVKNLAIPRTQKM